MRVILCLAVTLLLFSISLADITLENINISKHGDSIYVDIITSRACRYQHFLTKTVPERIVVDLKETINNWSQKRFSNLPLKSIESVRTSQFRIKPEYIARVVLDINRPVKYMAEELAMGVRIKIPAVAGEQAFITWNAQTQVRSVSQEKRVEKAIKKRSGADKAVTSKKKSGVKIEAFPKRKLVEYKPLRNRDPFKPLIGTGGVQLVTGKLPAVENLTLVGILEEESGNRALFEDSEGNGYILKPLDPVNKGYLVSIKKDKAIFQITEYGWTRTVALNLQIEEIK